MARIFVYDGREFPDPDPNMDVEDVKRSMADFFGEIATAQTKETKRDDDTIYEFVRRVGTKGLNFEGLADILSEVPETNLKLLDIAHERISADGGVEIPQFDQTDEWLSAVEQAQNYTEDVQRLNRALERLCREYRV